jgi:quercetin dioxygenase-like cupin family protein
MIDLDHHFIGGVYAKAIHFKRGDWAQQHKHTHEHMSVIASGFCTVTIDNHRVSYGPGSVLRIPAGIAHTVYANTDATWLCIHATEETDPAKVDHQLIAQDAPPPADSTGT